MTNERTVPSSGKHEKLAKNSVGRTEIRIGRRDDDLKLEVVGGDAAGFDVYRDMCVARLEENIFDSEERGDDIQAQADRDVMDFLTSLDPSVAEAENVSMIGLAHKKLEKIQDFLTADIMNAGMKGDLEYQALVAANGINMMSAISDSIQKTWLDSRDAGNEDQQISKEAELKSTLVRQHNARVHRNASRRGIVSEANATATSGGLNDEAILAAQRQLETMSSSKKVSVNEAKDIQPESRVSSDWKERHEFAKEFFGGDMNKHPLERSEENKGVLKDYLVEEVKMWARNARSGQEKHGSNLRYAGTMAGVMGIQIGVADSGPQRFAFDIVRFAENDPGMMYDSFQSLKFKDFAKKYLGLDVTDAVSDYDNLFS